MLNSLNTSKAFLLLLFALVLILAIQTSNAAASNEDFSESAGDTDEYQTREQALRELRRFLLTSNPEQRAARRLEQNLYKRKLIREYLDSVNNADPDHVEQMKKRFTYCPIEDLIGGSLCRRDVMSN